MSVWTTTSRGKTLAYRSGLPKHTAVCARHGKQPTMTRTRTMRAPPREVPQQQRRRRRRRRRHRSTPPPTTRRADKSLRIFFAPFRQRWPRTKELSRTRLFKRFRVSFLRSLPAAGRRFYNVVFFYCLWLLFARARTHTHT